MRLEHVRRLNDVVIDTDQNHVVFVHGRTFLSRLWRPASVPAGTPTLSSVGVLSTRKLASHGKRINVRSTPGTHQTADRPR
jgi:hypothetical protein